jgi:hypothetical protein
MTINQAFSLGMHAPVRHTEVLAANMLTIVVGTIGLLAGALLCGAVIVAASRRYRQDGNVGKLLVSLLAAVVALI